MMQSKFNLWLLAIALLALLALTSGCAVEGCTNPFSDNYNPEATEDDGSCVLAREKFLAQYSVTEACPSGNYSFNMNIAASTTADDAVILNNLGDFGQAVNGTVSGTSITIPNQNISDQGFTISINGSGSINGNLLIINYSYDFSGTGETCSMNCTKQ
jgi:hypothetical protein